MGKFFVVGMLVDENETGFLTCESVISGRWLPCYFICIGCVSLVH